LIRIGIISFMNRTKKSNGDAKQSNGQPLTDAFAFTAAADNLGNRELRN
jgi:hypothetical protein